MAASRPFASLTRAPARVPVGGIELTVPWRSAIDWIEALGSNPDTVAVMLAGDVDEITYAMATGDVTAAHVRDASHQLLEEMTGRKWWVALKLVATSAGTSVLGELTLAGVDIERVSFPAWCAAAYRVLTRNCDAKERSKLDFELELPPPGYEEAWDDENDFEAMAALARQYQQG